MYRSCTCFVLKYCSHDFDSQRDSDRTNSEITGMFYTELNNHSLIIIILKFRLLACFLFILYSHTCEA
jgi:hypothetical protein